MNTKNLVLMALLVGVGATLYVIIPGINNGMKPDFMLTMMFIGILLFPSIKETFLLSIATGVLSGLFSTFPGGFVPNIIDKAVTGFLFLLFLIVLRQIAKKQMVMIPLVAVGTIISGSTFLAMALLLTEVPIPFSVLFVTVVLPTTLLNTIAFIIIFPIIGKLLKRSSFKTALSHV